MNWQVFLTIHSGLKKGERERERGEDGFSFTINVDVVIACVLLVRLQSCLLAFPMLSW